MGLKRKPPANNVRRVAAIGNNSRSTIRNKNGATVQCESFGGERKLALCFERDPTVRDYQSQPLRIPYVDSCLTLNEGRKLLENIVIKKVGDMWSILKFRIHYRMIP